MSTDEELLVVVSEAQLALLRKLDFPCTAKLLASARVTEEGVELAGSYHALDDLVGWVAGEANHSRSTRANRRTELLDDLADLLEAELAGRSPG